MSTTIAIIIITAIVSFTSFNSPKAINDLSMWPVMIDGKKQYYRFITSGFIHGDYMHLIFNMFTLYFFGPIVERSLIPLIAHVSPADPSSFNLIVSLYYIGFYLLALIASDLPSYFKHRRDYGFRSIGASGAVSAIIFASILLDPWMSIGIMGIIPVPAIIYAVLYVVYCIYAGRRGGDNINHDAHLWGGLFGFAFSLILCPPLFKFFLDQLAHPRF